MFPAWVLSIFLANSVVAVPLSCEEARKLRIPDSELEIIGKEWCGALFGPGSSAADHLIFAYTSMCFGKINSELRKTSSANANALKIASQMDAALCDFPIFQGTVYRGARLPDAVLADYLASKTLVMPAFTSASEEHSIGCRYAGNTIFKIRSKNGRSISEFSKFNFEKEVLFRLNSEFKVIRISKDPECPKAQYLFELEEI